MSWQGAVIAALVLAAAAAAGVWFAGRHEGFASPEAHEFAARAAELFSATGGAASFGEFRRKLDGVAGPADAVQYADARALWRRRALTPAAAQSLL